MKIILQTCPAGWSLLLPILLIGSCQQANDNHQGDKEEILATEHAFKERVADHGIRDAFVYFADDHAVLVRNDRLIEGKEKISEYYEHQGTEDMNLTWEPEYVGVATCGDLAYTYGTYTFSVKDSTGREIISKGIFHTVWKRQEDGSWKYVYD
jgi:ketosteroid isomerase-like protein